VEAGSHQVTLRKPGYLTWTNRVEVSADRTLPLRITLSRTF
jgi:hypothetical protein